MIMNIVIPKLGMSVDEVNLVEWKVAEGDKVEQGDTVLMVETQKTEWNIEAEGAGFIHILMEAGSKAQIGTVVGLIAETKEELEGLQKTSRDASTATIVTSTYVTPGRAPAGVVPPDAEPAEGGRGKIKITPVARKMAEEQMIDVAGITGSGPGGRITREDIEKAIEDKKGVKEKEAKEPGKAAVLVQGKRLRESIPLKGMRKAIAEHMYRSLSNAAQMTVMGEFDMTETVRLRESLVKNESPAGARISYIDILVYVLARALGEHRDINCSLMENELKIWEDISIGVAVAMGVEGLIVPVIRNADQKTLTVISREVRTLAEKAQTGKLLPDDLTGGTFTLTSLGRKGVSYFQTPILNQPEAAILATGPITEKPVVRAGQIVIAPVMPFSMTFDHRAINGFGAEQFMGKVALFLANPGLLLL